MITLSADRVTLTLDETLGGEICQIAFDGDPLLAFHRWAAPIAMSRSRSYGDAKLDWLSEYRGGWQLLVPNAGAACVVDDVPLPFHGEWSRTAVEVVAHDAASVTLNAGARLPLVVHRRVAVLTEPSRVDVTTTVENLVDHALPFVWGEHPAFQAAPGDRIDLPGGSVVSADAPGTPVPWPDSPATTADLDRVAEDVPLQGVHYLPERPAGWAALRRPHVGVGLAWNVADFPHVWLWHEIGGPEFPFFGRTSLVAIEPASSWPGDGLAAAIERGQAHWLAPRSSRTTTVTLVPFRPVGRPVTNVERGGTVTFEEGAA